MILVFLANGFEEIEALATVDVLRRAGLNAITVGIGNKTITGAHGIAVEADYTDMEPFPNEVLQAIVLPGGIPGTPNLESSSTVSAWLERANQQDAFVCAICAAPSILGHRGMLVGKKATCYPGYEQDLTYAVVTGESVSIDGKYITAKGAGVTLDFALTMVECLVSSQKAKELKEAMQCQ